jgi:hypothetical protein
MNKLGLIAAMSALLLPTPGAAEDSGPFLSGDTLFERCTRGDETGDDFCIGYVAGSVDMLISLQRQGPPGAKQACMPQGVTLGQVRDVVIKYLSDEPQFRKLDAAALVITALEQAFPCSDQGG